MPQEVVEIACSECKRRNYSSFKNSKKKERIQLRKFCKWCRKHTLHKEIK